MYIIATRSDVSKLPVGLLKAFGGTVRGGPLRIVIRCNVIHTINRRTNSVCIDNALEGFGASDSIPAVGDVLNS